MACDKTLGDCRPCLECQEVVPPITPRCDVVLPDGVYTNATIYVDNGCIVRLQSGEPLLYRPDPCCAVAGDGNGGGGADGLMGQKGDPGQNATITIGTVQTVDAGKPARIWNSGTATNAVLNFEIPKGSQGEAASGSSGDDFEGGGLVVENGLITEVPLRWLVISEIVGDQNDPSFKVNPEYDPETGLLTLRIDGSGFAQSLTKALGDQLAARDTRIAALEEAMAKAQADIVALKAAVAKAGN